MLLTHISMQLATLHLQAECIMLADKLLTDINTLLTTYPLELLLINNN